MKNIFRRKTTRLSSMIVLDGDSSSKLLSVAITDAPNSAF